MSSGNWISISIKENKLEFKSKFGIPTQAESQKIIYILPVLDSFLENKSVNITELEQTIPVSRDSIDRTIQLILKYNMIKLEEISLRNKKFYTIKNRNRMKLYRNKLAQWLWIKEIKQDHKTLTELEFRLNSSKRIGKQVKRNFKKNIFSKRKTTDLLYRSLILEGPRRKKSHFILIRDLPYSKARKIIKDYLNGKFCETCLKNNRLSLLQTDLEEYEEGCKLGHVFKYNLI